ncbi:hypothetical protein D3C86_1621890 [compost metagenome]
MVAVAGLDFGDRVDASDGVQITPVLEIEGFAAADRQVLAAQAVLFDVQPFALQLHGRRRARAQAHDPMFTVAQQTQVDLGRQAGAPATGAGPGRMKVLVLAP